jgi:PD-(D/E)XK endonuclease
MFNNCKNSKKQGDFGLGRAISYYCSLGYTVSVPLTDSQNYDLIVENGSLQRVQVKTTTHKPKGRYVVNMRTMGGNQKEYWCKKLDKSSIEILFILTDENDIYIIPTSEIKAMSSICLGKIYDKYKILAGVPTVNL